jgi:carbonic anhydrase
MKTNFEDYVTQLSYTAAAAEKPTVFLLSCMDYRYAHRIIDVMDNQGLRRKYDIFALGGAAAGANEVEAWRDVFVEHVKVARSIGHPIDHIVILEHRDCGAYKKFFGLDWAEVTPPVEAAKHLEQVKIFSAYLHHALDEEIQHLQIDSFLLARDEDDPLQINQAAD